jgi:hypothetical protein
MAGRHVPSDLTVSWHNDFLKARQGTYIPVVLTIEGRVLATPAVLVYVRLVPRRGGAGTAGAQNRTRGGGWVEEVFPVELSAPSAETTRVTRGLAAPPGEYDLIVVARERVDPDQSGLPRRTAVLSRQLLVPDFGGGELAASSVILADRLTVLDRLPADAHSGEHPYLIGLSEIQPAPDTRFSRREELVVVLLVYHPFVTPERQFDIEVEYHFFARTGDAAARGGPAPPGVVRPQARDGERYFNHTKPQRFTPAVVGPDFDAAAGHPLLAGQGIPLAGFPEGDYRLAITVTDVTTGRSLLRDASFTVVN